MIRYTDIRSQHGVALILSLLILLVLTVIGVAAMNSTIMQERMAGNTKTQADVFETSSEGVSRSLELFYGNAGNLSILNDENNPYNLACGQLFGGTSNEAWVFPEDGSWHVASDDGENPKLEQKMYCCQSWLHDTEFDQWVENPSKLFALSRATFLGGADNDESLALREIEVRLAEAEPDDPTCAICAPGTVGDVNGANSNAFRVDGACGAAITTETATDAANFISGIPERRRVNYDGGIVGGRMGAPWDNPRNMAEFVFWAKLNLHANGKGRYWREGETPDPDTFPHPETDDPEIHYIEGDLAMSGNDHGYGIFLVNGDLTFNGTPELKGLMVVLDGNIHIGGGGQGKPDGSFVITNLKHVDDTLGETVDLKGPEVLEYPIVMEGDEVSMYDPELIPQNSDVRRAESAGGYGGAGSDNVPVRPVLRAINVATGAARRVVHFRNDDGTHRYFDYGPYGDTTPTGDELDTTVSTGVFTLENPDDGTVYEVIPPVDPPRDKFGRLIPDYVWNDNYPEDYGYNPNVWFWTPDTPQFELRTTDFSWSGGGNESIGYDCRKLQQVRHQLLCEEPIQPLPADPHDDFYKDPDHSDYCAHYVEGEEYGVASPPLDNQMAWHLWDPSCDCLGVSVDADMVVAGWRENLGWRDSEEFQGCSGLPSPGS